VVNIFALKYIFGLWIGEVMDDGEEPRPEKELMERVGPYLSDLHVAGFIIEDAYDTEDPEAYLVNKMKEVSGPLKADIRIMLNHLRR
jgi:hypothetical protein